MGLVLVQIIQEENKPDPVMPNYYYYPSMPAQSATSYRRVKSPRKPKKPTPARAIPPRQMRQQQVPFNHDLAGILSVIPPSYDDVSVHYNFPNKRHRREAEEEEDDADEEAIDEALIVALEYAEWYDNVYMPWYVSQEHMLEDLENLSHVKVDHSLSLSH